MEPHMEWAACDLCNRWRRVPQSELPADDAEWSCSMSSDPLFNSCDAPEEAWDEAEWQSAGGWVEQEPCGDLIAPGWTLMRQPIKRALTEAERDELRTTYLRLWEERKPQKVHLASGYTIEYHEWNNVERGTARRRRKGTVLGPDGSKVATSANGLDRYLVAEAAEAAESPGESAACSAPVACYISPKGRQIASLEGARALAEREAVEMAREAKREETRAAQEAADNAPTWVACESCDRWRRVRAADAPAGSVKWFCSMNHADAARSTCAAPEEAWDEAEWGEKWETVTLKGSKRTTHVEAAAQAAQAAAAQAEAEAAAAESDAGTASGAAAEQKAAARAAAARAAVDAAAANEAEAAARLLEERRASNLALDAQLEQPGATGVAALSLPASDAAACAACLQVRLIGHPSPLSPRPRPTASPPPPTPAPHPPRHAMGWTRGSAGAVEALRAGACQREARARLRHLPQDPVGPLGLAAARTHATRDQQSPR